MPVGKLANVATFLEMRSRPQPKVDPHTPRCVLRRVLEPDPQWYRALFRAVGEPWLWSSRLVMSDDDLLKIVRDPTVEVYVLNLDGQESGFMELDFRVRGECELAFFGLTKNAVGHGMGRWLMNRAIELAWERPITRFWVHTCSLDHPSALPFYVRSGFVPFKRQIEIYDDPRLSGALSKTAAPDVPVL